MLNKTHRGFAVVREMGLVLPLGDDVLHEVEAPPTSCLIRLLDSFLPPTLLALVSRLWGQRRLHMNYTYTMYGALQAYNETT